MNRPIWLVGMMGSGKSTIAPLVAQALDMAWIDTDLVIEEMTGSTVAELFAESEAAFRALEVDVIRSLATTPGVVATGGGAATTAAADVMADSGLIVWLQASVPTLVARVGDGESRPLLLDGVGSLRRIARERASAYERIADIVIDTDDMGPDSVAAKVVEAWRNASSQV